MHPGTVMPRNSHWIARIAVQAVKGHVCKGGLTWGPLSSWISKCCVWLYPHHSLYVLAWMFHIVYSIVYSKQICIHFKMNIAKRAGKHMQLYSISFQVNAFTSEQQNSAAFCMLFLWPCFPARTVSYFKRESLQLSEVGEMWFKPLEAKDILNPIFLGWIIWPLG